MKPLKRLIATFVLTLVLVLSSGCESTPSTTQDSDSSASSSSLKDPGGARVWIARPDGSKSCETDSGRDLRDDEERLRDAGIRVFESTKGDDGMMHMQVCGAETGKQNRYLIAVLSLSDAQKLGFEVVKE